MYDIDDEADLDNLDGQEFIGEVEVSVQDLFLSINEPLRKDLQPKAKSGKKSKKNLGKVVLKVAESDICQSRVKFNLAVEDMTTRNHIIISIKGSSNNKEYFMIHTTPKRKNTSKGCVFPEFSVNSNKIGEESSNIKFEFYEIKKQNPKLIGEVEISLMGLHNNSNTKISIFRNAFVVGKLRASLRKDDNNNFLNYIYDGFSIKLVCAVDFCAKARGMVYNDPHGDLSSNKTLISYKEALMEVGTLLKYYDDDARTVALGFGAKLKPYFNVVSHCFALNGNYFEPAMHDLTDIAAEIGSALGQVELHGPKIISEVIKYSLEIAAHFKQTNHK